jgi:organic hydroperoxide reductase OsmC/OhrA
MKNHHYTTGVNWTGNKGKGTQSYTAYTRDYSISAGGKPVIEGSSDPAFRGDKNRYNPEELLLASISSCHMLWYLHLCSENGIIVTSYTDTAKGVMTETADGGGRFTEVTLYPIVTVTESSMIEKANELHAEANKLCFIANSCNFPILHRPVTTQV